MQDEIEALRLRIEGSEIFIIRQEEQPDKYRDLALTLVGDLYRCACLISRKRYGDMGLEIVETAQSCLKSYKPEKGPFFHYFMLSLKRRVNQALACRKDLEKRGGMAVPLHLQQQMQQLRAVAGAKQLPTDDPEVTAAAAEVLGLPEERIRTLAALDARTAVIRENAEGEGDIWAYLTDGADPEDGVIGAADAAVAWTALEKCFLRSRRDQRTALAQLLTARLLTAVPDQLHRFRNAAYFDESVCDTYRKTGKAPTEKEFARQWGRHESSVCRTLSQFLSKVKLQISEENYYE